MPSGKVIQLVCLLPQPKLPRAPRTPGKHDQSYGILQAEDGQEVYFSHELIAGLHGFDDLRRGQQLDFTFDEPFMRAASVQLTVVPAAWPQPAAGSPA